MNKNKIRPLNLKDVVIGGPFWSHYVEQIRKKVIPYQWDVLNDRVEDAKLSHCIKNFEIAAGKRDGAFYGMVFQDSDLYKWLESVAYTLAVYPDADLERLADDVIALIKAAQQADGYVNTYYTVKERSGRWTNLQHGHELYCAGHLIEAAVAYYNATNKSEILEIAIRFADYIDTVFGLEAGKLKGYPGHQEIELALFKLYEITAERRYLRLAAYFIKQRGQVPNYFDLEAKKPEYKEIFPEITPLARTYSQSHIAPEKQREAVGHAVRAVYMYCAMADLADELDDKDLREALDALYTDITSKQMYVTGAIGSVAWGERFSGAYDLPNDLVYGETCASVGLMMFCRRMNAMYMEADYADTMELALYNTVLAGISLSGTEFYYVNPLQVEPERIKVNPNFSHVKIVRQKWFDCACCPSNLARTVMGLGLYAYGSTTDALYVNLYCAGSAQDGARKLEVETDYPYGNVVKCKVSGGSFKLYLRNPKYAPLKSLTLNGETISPKIEKGYLVLERDWNDDVLTICFDMQPKRIYCANEVQQNIGHVAIMRGPLVYCIEQVDNGPLLGTFRLVDEDPITAVASPKGLSPEAVALRVPAYQYRQVEEALYTKQKSNLVPSQLTLIPYFLWANRGENEMRVFIPSLPRHP
ncbi:MAG: glycoside hydrolase family 127 protein [Lachnospiraceae bacterium]|nr:glycoside hydrolase family 127 protein [Lachnospiraceae bacterium]